MAGRYIIYAFLFPQELLAISDIDARLRKVFHPTSSHIIDSAVSPGADSRRSSHTAGVERHIDCLNAEAVIAAAGNVMN